MNLKVIVLCVLGLLSTVTAFADTVIIDATKYANVAAAADACNGVDPCIVLVPDGKNYVPRSVRVKSNTTLIGKKNSVITTPGSASTFPPIVIEGTQTLIGQIWNSMRENTAIAPINRPEIEAGDMIKLVAGNILYDPVNLDAQVATVTATDGLFATLKTNIGQALPQWSGLLKINPVTNVRIENITVEGYESQPMLVRFASNVTLNNVKFTYGNPGLPTTPNIVMGLQVDCSEDVTIQRCWFDIAKLHVCSSNRVSVRNSEFYRSLCGSIALFATNYSDVTDNIVNGELSYGATGLHGDGINLTGSWNNVVSGNRLKDASCYGIWLTGRSGRNQVLRNTVRDSYTLGIYDYEGVENTISSNWVYTVLTNNAIGTEGSTRPRVLDNYVQGAGVGLVSINCTQPLYTDNVTMYCSISWFYTGNTDLVEFRNVPSL